MSAAVFLRRKWFWNLRWAAWVPVYLGSTAYLLNSCLREQPLYDPHPTVNLSLRFLVMDFIPVLWVVPWFWKKIPSGRRFLNNLWRIGSRKPLFLAAPSLAVVLFFLESLREVRNPETAGPASWGTVLWMQAAAALMAGAVLGCGTGLFEGEKKTGPKNHLSVLASRFLFLLLAAGGLAYFLSADCDISRLLVVLGVASIGIQFFVDAPHWFTRN